MSHIPVLLEEVLDGFSGVHIDSFYEGTLGAGGHAKEILSHHPEISLYMGCDRDPEALEMAKDLLSPWEEKMELFQGDFVDLDRHLASFGKEAADGFFLI